MVIVSKDRCTAAHLGDSCVITVQTDKSRGISNLIMGCLRGGTTVNLGSYSSHDAEKVLDEIVVARAQKNMRFYMPE